MRRTWGLLAIAATALLPGALPAEANAASGSFSNTNAITPPDLDNAEPSNITVTGMTGVVTDVNVFLNNVSHTNPDDFEVLLVAPAGQSIVLMNDVGGNTDISNLNFSLNDEAAGPIPDNGPIMSQGYEPSDSSAQPGLEPFIAPAPSPPYGLTLSLADGTNPNGTWTLYVDDDLFNALTGSIAGGWTLSLTTTDVAPAATPTPVTAATGERAAALLKCLKKKTRKARKKCGRRALKLPL